MKKIFITIFLITIPIQIILAGITSISKEDVAADTFYANDINKLTYKINLSGTGTDILNSIEIGNQGTADESADITQIKLWYQATGGTFNPATATLICVLPRTAIKTWAKSNINFTVAAGSSLYISTDIVSNPGNNKTVKMSLAKNKLSIGSNTYPATALTNANTQTISNPPKIKISYTNFMPGKVNIGQENILTVRYYFLNTGSVTISINNIILRTINYSGEIIANTALSRIVLKKENTTYADLTTIPTSSQISIALSPGLSIPGGNENYFDVFIYLKSNINTRDIGIRLLQGSDVTTNNEPIPKESKGGYSFPMDTTLSLITLPVSSVNVSRTNIMPSFATDNQSNIQSLVLTFTHPQSVTTYADCSIRGITLSAWSATNPSLKDNNLFSKVKIYDNVTTYAEVIPLSGTNQIFIPFSNYLNIASGTFKSVTISVDIKSGLFDNNFFVSVSRTADIISYDGSSGVTITANGSFPLASSLCMIQRISSLGIYHINKMPSIAISGQKFVYAEDFIVTNPNSGNYAPVVIKGITLQTEDNLGNTIIPFSVISKITILDSNNNTVVSYSAIPTSGYKIYIDFTNPVILTATASETLKVFIDISNSPSGSYVKLNLNSSLNVNAVDGNSLNIPVSVIATAGDIFPMKTSTAQILNAATNIKVKHENTMPVSVNEGQENVVPITLNFLNDSGSIVSIEKINFRFYDNLNNSISANSVLSNIKIDNKNNTSLVYADVSITTNSASFDLILLSPILVNYGVVNSVTVNVKVKIASPATSNNFKMSIIGNTSITAKDSGTGNTITVIANNDSFPMSSGVVLIEKRANTLTVSHDGTNSGNAQKGDANVNVMELFFENPVNNTCDIIVTGITLTTEDALNNTISALTAISRIMLIDKNTSLTYGEITSIPSSPYLYFSLSKPITISAGVGNGVTCSVKVNIAPFATASSLKLNLNSASFVNAFDKNQDFYVTVTAKTPDIFPMRSATINITSANKMTVLYINTMPQTVSNGQIGIKPFILRFSNVSDSPVAVHGITLTVENILNAGIIPGTLIDKIYLIDSNVNTNIVSSAIPLTGDKIYLTFSQDVTISASSYKDVSVFVDLKNNTFTANFQLNLSSSFYIQALPVTLTVEPDASFSFPMRSSNALIQLKPIFGGISHSDVIPTTVSTGQSNIFAEILHIANYNITGSADIQLAGITITVEDDTNTIINPSSALKKIMIRDENNIYAFFSSIPSSKSPFYVPFIIPVTLSVSQTADLKLYIDIVDTINTGNFQINIKIDADVCFRDKNSGVTITAQAINGDSFPMRTSVVIIQEKATLCKVGYQDLMPFAVNKGQENITAMKLTFLNTGSANGANVLITRLVLNTENSSDVSIIPKTAISRLYIKDQTGVIYGDVLTVPDYGDSVSIALTTPITVQVGEKKEVFVVGNINPDATANNFKLSLKSASGVIARDANSYDIISVAGDNGFSFPMKTSATLIQNISQTLNIGHYGIITPTVNKTDTDVPAIYFEFINPNPYGYSSAILKGITITVEDNTGTGIVPSSVISKLKIAGTSTYGISSNIPFTGSSVYIPLTITPLIIAPLTSVGVTLYADILNTTEQLYLQLDLKQPSDCYVEDINSKTPISGINAVSGDNFPMRSGATTIINPPGIKVSHIDLSPVSVSEAQGNIEILKLKFSNIGSFSENITGITLTVKDASGNSINAGLILNNAILVDDTGNTYNTIANISGSSVFIGLTETSFEILPRDYKEAYIYIDLKSATFSALFYLSLSSSSDILTSSPVFAQSPDTFPMNTKQILLQRKTVSINVSGIDWMPPTVSTGQRDVFAMYITLENNSPSGYSPVVISGITITVKDALSHTISAMSAISKIILSDLTTDYVVNSSMPIGSNVFCKFSEPLILPTGNTKTLYLIVDITGNTLNKANDFKLVIDDSNSFIAKDYNSGENVLVQIKSGYTYPIETSSALIQKKATNLKVNHINTMPLSVSTDQENVSVMNLILENSGDTLTASIMITRINFYIKDIADVNINPRDVIKEILITSQDGAMVFGSNSVLSSTKIVVNLTAPVIVSSAMPVTVSVKVKIASSYLKDIFKVSLESNNDIYALDANSFELLTVSNKLPDVFPMKSNITKIQDKVTNVNLVNFINLLKLVVTKGENYVPLFVFKIENNLNTLTANALFSSITITVKDGSDNDISANSVIKTLYITDGLGNTIGSNNTGVSNKIAIKFSSPLIISPSSANYITVYADILGTAIADDFKVLLSNSTEISITDANSGNQVPKVILPSFPWETGVAGVFNAPATDLILWRSNFAPTQAGVGQTDIRFISLSMYNPGSVGTSNVIVSGVTITVIDNWGNTLSPADIIRYARISDFAELTGYGNITTTSLTTPEPFYINFTNPIAVEASNTKTVYLYADISSSTVLTSFKMGVNLPEHINAYNYPSGSITITAGNSDSFPLISGLVSKMMTTYILRVGHKNLMPVSVAKGDKNIKVLELNFENKDAGQYLDITGITLTVKDKNGNELAANRVLDALNIEDINGNTLYGVASIGSSGKIFIQVSSFRVNKLSEKSFVVKINIKEDASNSFYIELEKENDLSTNPLSTIQAATGDFFGNMKTNFVSIQEANLEKSFHSFPNPFNPEKQEAVIEYYLEKDANVSLKIFTLDGRPVKNILINEFKSKGLHNEDKWNGKNEVKAKVKSGIYLCVIEVKYASGESKKLIKKIAVMR